MTPMLICIPFWSGDKGAAYDLCRIIAGLQETHVGNTAHVMLIARQDCTHDINMIKIVMAKFNTFTFISKSSMKGWPDGPNGMFGSTMIHVSLNNKKNQYECVYWMEPDAIPLCPNWFMDLLNVWRSRHPKAIIVGNRGDAHGDGSGDHITGCALYHPNISRLFPEITHSSGMAWDWMHREKIVQLGQHTHLIENQYKVKNYTEDMFVNHLGRGIKVTHGVKDRSLVTLVAKKYNIKLD